MLARDPKSLKSEEKVFIPFFALLSLLKYFRMVSNKMFCESNKTQEKEECYACTRLIPCLLK